VHGVIEHFGFDKLKEARDALIFRFVLTNVLLLLPPPLLSLLLLLLLLLLHTPAGCAWCD
jgi:hypothetical protein